MSNINTNQTDETAVNAEVVVMPDLLSILQDEPKPEPVIRITPKTVKDGIKQIQTAIKTTPDGIWGKKSAAALKDALSNGVIIPVTADITLNELLASQTATRLNIDNMPDAKILNNLVESAIFLWQPTRDILGQPIIITSGYRSPLLNSRIGGSANSAHKFGYAIDFSCPAFGNTRQVVAFLIKAFKRRGIRFDQLILEYPRNPNSWVHLGYKNANGSQRKQAFTIA